MQVATLHFKVLVQYMAIFTNPQLINNVKVINEIQPSIFILSISTDRPEQTVQTQIRYRILWHLIRDYTG